MSRPDVAVAALKIDLKEENWRGMKILPLRPKENQLWFVTKWNKKEPEVIQKFGDLWSYKSKSFSICHQI